MPTFTRDEPEASPLWIVFTRDEVEVANDLCTSGRDAAMRACVLIARIGELQAGDRLRVIAGSDPVISFPNVPRRPQRPGD